MLIGGLLLAGVGDAARGFWVDCLLTGACKSLHTALTSLLRAHADRPSHTALPSSSASVALPFCPGFGEAILALPASRSVLHFIVYSASIAALALRPSASPPLLSLTPPHRIHHRQDITPTL